LNYHVDTANTHAAQNQQSMDNYNSGSMIDLPPSITNIYATATATNESSSNIDEKLIMNHSMNMVNQPITINDLSHKQKRF